MLKKSPDLHVSVVIPLYNHERYIEAALRSVWAQTTPPAEIIVIDDGSIDGSAEKVRQLCEDHPEVIFWSWPNQGAHHALNAGIFRATGDFVAILNSDDCYHPERLQACLAAVQSDPSVDVVATGLSFLDDQGFSALNPWYDDALAFYRREGDIALSLYHANFLVSTSNLFIRRSLFESIGSFAPLRYTHDLEFCLRLIVGKKKLFFLDKPLLAYRLHEKNTIAENKQREEVERAAVLAFFLYRKWRGQGTDESWRCALERYVELLTQQDIVEMVEHFLSLLDDKAGSMDVVVTDPLPTEFLAFLSRLGVDWVAPGTADEFLSRFGAARQVFMRRSMQTRSIAGLQADVQWLQQQRDAWEQQAHAQQVQALATDRAVAELRAGNTWLQQQRDAWEQQAHAQQAQAFATERAVEELRAGNAWLQQQRDAWEQVAGKTQNELAGCKAALQELSDQRLVRWLIQTKLLRLNHPYFDTQ